MQTGEHPVDAFSAPALPARRTSPAPAYAPDEKVPLSEPISEEAEAAAAVHLPAETNAATIAFLIPFPPTDIYQTVKDKDKVPPFCLYGPLAPRLSKPAEGEKESLIHKAQRKMEEEEEAAKGADGVKAKAVRLISKGELPTIFGLQSLSDFRDVHDQELGCRIPHVGMLCCPGLC
jgi:hypothetical protein